MDILKRIDQAQQFCKFYADGAYSIETEKWNHHVTPELIEDIRQNIESLQLKLMHQQTEQAKPYTFLWEADGSCEAVKGHVSASQNTGPAHGWKITPLYAAPPEVEAQQVAAPALTPLTPEQTHEALTAASVDTFYMTHAVTRKELWFTQGSTDVMSIVRAIERAHGIVEKP